VKKLFNLGVTVGIIIGIVLGGAGMYIYVSVTGKLPGRN
jgi:hypothetical protein